MGTATETPTRTTHKWQLDPAHTNVEFAAKHLMISSVKGRFAGVSGTLETSDASPNDFALEVSIDSASIDTRQEQRDAHLRSPDFLDTLIWPKLSFSGKRIEGDVRGDFVLYGDLTIRDVTKEIKLEVTNEGSVRDPWGGSRMGFSAKTKIDRRDFGLVWNQVLEAGGFVVGDEIRITVDAEVTAIAEAAAA